MTGEEDKSGEGFAGAVITGPEGQPSAATAGLTTEQLKEMIVGVVRGTMQSATASRAAASSQPGEGTWDPWSAAAGNIKKDPNDKNEKDGNTKDNELDQDQ
eukprot:9359226-Pyramimonas_sp.AAC.1